MRQLPWSTSNEDLVELFQTTGTVEHAEVLFEHGRSKGAGVVQFASIEDATTAVTRFNGYALLLPARHGGFEAPPLILSCPGFPRSHRYMYGGRPLALDYNQRPYIFAQPVDGAPTGPAGMMPDAAVPIEDVPAV